MSKFLIAAEIIAYLAVATLFAFGIVPVEKYSNEIIRQAATAAILIVFCVLFLLSASASKNYFAFRTPFISFMIMIICFSINNFSDILISGDLFCIVIFALALVFFASKGETELFFPAIVMFALAIFAFVFYKQEGMLVNFTPTNIFFVSFSAISAIFAFVSSHFNNKMKIFNKEAELKVRMAHKIQNISRRRNL